MRGLLRGSFSRFLGGDCFDLRFFGGGIDALARKSQEFPFSFRFLRPRRDFCGDFSFFEDSPIVTTKETPAIFAFLDSGGGYT